MKNIITIIKKELMRVFKDRRLIFAIILPGIMIYIMYTFMGTAFTGADEEAKNAVYDIVAINMPTEIKTIFELEELELNAEFNEFTLTKEEAEEKVEQSKESIKNGELDLLLYFDPNFVEDVVAGLVPEVAVYYNPVEARSSYAYAKIEAGLNIFKSAMINQEIYLNNIQPLYNEKSAAAKGVALILPMLLITFLFSGSMAVAPDSIAGEKERGTISTILITPIKRSELAIGKIVALSILAFISALSSFIGLMLSLPKLLGTEVSITDVFSVGDFALLFLILIATTALIIGAMSVISSFAKTVKEATMLIMPFMVVSMLAGVVSMVGTGAYENILFYIIPIFNSTQAIVSVLTFEVSIINFVVAIISNFAYLLICVFVLAKLFNNEKIMFSK